MLKQMLPELRAWANEVGAAWRDVVAVKNELLEQEQTERYHTDDVRRRAWQLHCHYSMTDGCLSFWRCGWDHVRRRLDKKQLDFTSIRRFDVIHQQIAEEFHEWGGRAAEDLFEWLLNTPYQPWPPRHEFYERAIARIEQQTACSSLHAATDWAEVEF